MSSRSAIGRADAVYARLRAHKRAVERAERVVRSALSSECRWVVSYSGGKDSTCVLDLVRRSPGGGDTPAIFLDSGAEFPETYWLMEITPNVITEYPELSLLDMYRTVGDYGSDGDRELMWGKGDVKRNLISEPMLRAMKKYGWSGSFTGLRGEESSGRRAMISSRAPIWTTSEGAQRCEPIGAWSYRDVWAYIAERNLRYNPVYDRLAALGVPRREWRVAPYAGSTSLARGRWAWLKRGWPDLYNRFASVFPGISAYT